MKNTHGAIIHKHTNEETTFFCPLDACVGGDVADGLAPPSTNVAAAPGYPCLASFLESTSATSEIVCDSEMPDAADDGEIVGDTTGDARINGRLVSVRTGHSVTRLGDIVKHKRSPIRSVIVIVATILIS